MLILGTQYNCCGNPKYGDCRFPVVRAKLISCERRPEFNGDVMYLCQRCLHEAVTPGDDRGYTETVELQWL